MCSLIVFIFWVWCLDFNGVFHLPFVCFFNSWCWKWCAFHGLWVDCLMDSKVCFFMYWIFVFKRLLIYICGNWLGVCMRETWIGFGWEWLFGFGWEFDDFFILSERNMNWLLETWFWSFVVAGCQIGVRRLF